MCTPSPLSSLAPVSSLADCNHTNFPTMPRQPLSRGLQFLGHRGYLPQQPPLSSVSALNSPNPRDPILHQKPCFQYYAYDFNHAFSIQYPRPLVTALPKFKEQVELKREDIALEEAVEDHDDEYSDIRLRQMTLSDVDDLLEWSADEKARKFWCPLMSKREAIRCINHARIPPKAICLKDNNKPIGLISVIECQNKSCEIGYVLASKYRGKGIMTKAVKMVASNIFVELPYIEKIEAEVDFENIRSQRVLEKVGFTKNRIHTTSEFTFTLLPSDLEDN